VNDRKTVQEPSFDKKYEREIIRERSSWANAPAEA